MSADGAARFTPKLSPSTLGTPAVGMVLPEERAAQAHWHSGGWPAGYALEQRNGYKSPVSSSPNTQRPHMPGELPPSRAGQGYGHHWYGGWSDSQRMPGYEPVDNPKGGWQSRYPVGPTALKSSVH
jgi:hypothetical protein